MSTASSDSRVQDRVFADFEERPQLFIDAGIDARVLVVGKQLLPFLVGDLVRGSGTHSLPPIVVFRRGNPGTVEAGPVMAHGVLGPEVVPAGADLTDAIHGE